MGSQTPLEHKGDAMLKDDKGYVLMPDEKFAGCGQASAATDLGWIGPCTDDGSMA